MATVHGLAVFVGVAALVTLTPGPATAMVIRSALRGGRRSAFLTTLGNSLGVLLWGVASALGVSALIAASELAFAVLKVTGAVVLLWLGVHSLARRRRRGEAPASTRHEDVWSPRAFRDGLVTCLANPKLAIFFVALFPQFLERGHSNVSTGLAMAGLIVALDLVWYSAVALAVTRIRRAFVSGPWHQRLERLTGSLMIGFGLRLALEAR
jgi:threonine/homoserine/homoserine lactone efflux protein